MTILLQVKGVGVAPAELEDLLLGHPLIHDCAVIGISDLYAGEVPKAFVVLTWHTPPGSLDEQCKEIMEYVKARTIRPKWLDGGVEVLKEIPRSAAGNILRKGVEGFGEAEKDG
jgi:4-coumarate--CoA ligase